MYQGLFTYLIVIAGFGGRGLAMMGILFFAAISIPATLISHASRLRPNHHRFCSPLLIGLTLPVLQIGVLMLLYR